MDGKGDGSSDICIVKSIHTANQAFNRLLESKDLIKDLEELKPLCERSPYHSMGYSACFCLFAILNFSPVDIEGAERASQDLIKVSNRYRKNGFVANIMRIVKTPNYKKFTDLEAHSELTHAIGLCMTTYAGALSVHNIYGLIKGVFRVRKCMKAFETIKSIMYEKSVWDSTESQQEFAAAVRLANGGVHLALSCVPPKLLKVVNFLGYYGSEETAFKNFNIAAFELNGSGMFSRFARMWLIGYWTWVEPHLTPNPHNLDVCKQVLEKELQEFPECVFYKAMEAKFALISGQLNKSIELMHQLLQTSNKRCHPAFHGYLAFNYGLQCKWDKAVNHAQLLREATAHSPACSTYAEAVFRYVKSRDENDLHMKRMATELFTIVPSLRIRHLGKTITPEKVAVVNSEKYLKCDEFLILPELDIIYQMNLFSFIRDNKVLLNKHLDRIENERQKFEIELKSSDYLDNYLSTLFYKGVILKFLGNYSEAKECFHMILDNESRIGREYSIPPQTVLELGLIELQLNNEEKAEEWFRKCIGDYHGYLNENYVHFIAYAGLRLMGIGRDKQIADDEKMKEYTKEWLKSMDIRKEKYEELIKED